jgi:uncharacterized membrane protein
MKKKVLTIASFSGFLIGLYTLFLKIGLKYEFIEYLKSFEMFKLFITNPFILLSFIFLAFGTYIFQIALHKGKSGLVNTFANIMILLIVIVGGLFFLFETINMLKILGISFIVVGMVLVNYKE